ncbi:trypsin-like peptidase domain-containing protein [Streptomyces pactum]|uniref:Trypsin-like peptidase domain-containing protein n=1 Tax=Streptomyces pactum TaxID=68249 RepID=A0ABS0NH63_9ACTN|nr:trypsin-like peptidase domain-containing protein [Streptomyces pactum]MBH5334472.1 trypsin-like peptidase domain-containing protein [Streptomyces pactum]
MDGSRSRRRPLSTVAMVCSVALLAGGGLAGCGFGGDDEGGGPASPAPPSVSLSSHRSAPERSRGEPPAGYEKTVAAVLPSVVQITTGKSLGSGVVYDGKGHVVTNAHVVGDAEKFEVTLATGKGTRSASLVYSYPDQDLAVIKLDEVPEGLRPAAFADSSEVEVGQIVLAMGSPLGLSSSVTQGIVSAVGRTVRAESDGGTGTMMSDLVQTSAPINPGNSGGALVNLANQVVGVPTLAATDPELGDAAAGIGFAIPSSTVTSIADQIISQGKVTDSGKAALGITARTLLGDDYQPAGVAVVSVAEDGPAAKAGIEAGDTIVAVDGAEVRSMTDLSEALAAHEPGDEATVGYERDGERHTARVTLGEL